MRKSIRKSPTTRKFSDPREVGDRWVPLTVKTAVEGAIIRHKGSEVQHRVTMTGFRFMGCVPGVVAEQVSPGLRCVTTFGIWVPESDEDGGSGFEVLIHGN